MLLTIIKEIQCSSLLKLSRVFLSYSQEIDENKWQVTNHSNSVWISGLGFRMIPFMSVILEQNNDTAFICHYGSLVTTDDTTIVLHFHRTFFIRFFASIKSRGSGLPLAKISRHNPSQRPWCLAVCAAWRGKMEWMKRERRKKEDPRRPEKYLALAVSISLRILSFNFGGRLYRIRHKSSFLRPFQAQIND